MLRSGYPSGESGSTYFLPAGTNKNPVYTDEFLERNGAKKYSSVVMTPSGYLTADAWKIIVPKFVKGIRHHVRVKCAKYGIPKETADKLLVGLAFDGFKIHTEEFLQLIDFADNNCLCACENRDSSEMNQAFDRYVAKAGKKRAAETLDMLRRSHIDPVIDKWTLIMVGLAMLRDCDSSKVWESSFIAVNMHPLHRINYEDFMQKLSGFTRAADKFDDEVIDLSSMLPKSWLKLPTDQRKRWLKLVKDHDEEFDVNLISALRKDGMTLALVANMFRIYETEKKIENGHGATTYKHDVQIKTPALPTPALQTPTPKKPSPKDQPMIYHLFKVPTAFDMKPLEKFDHAVTVRNRTLGPKRGTTVSPYLDVEITSMNKRMLKLKADDVNMYNVLQQSTCRSDVRRKVAKRTLTALGGASGMARLVNGPKQLVKLKANLEFAQSIEEVRAAEKALKRHDAEEKKKKALLIQKKKKARLAARVEKMKKDFDRAMTKLGLQRGMTVYRRHIDSLTAPQLKAVAHFQVGETLTATRIADMRSDMRQLLPVDPHRTAADEDDLPEYPTQDPLLMEDQLADKKIQADEDDEDSNSSEETTATEPIEFEHLLIGDIVEVYWKGEHTWFEGVITDVDAVDRLFEVLYKADSEKLWHCPKDYPVRDAA